MSRILVTGGAGFIGSSLVRQLLFSGHSVVILDDLSTGSIQNLDSLLTSANLRLVVGTILDLSLVDSLVQSVDQVYHLAASVGVKHILDDPLLGMHTNVQGTENVLASCFRYQKPILIVSTSEVYGKSTELPFSEDGDCVFGSTEIKRWSYAVSKALDEHMAKAYAAKGLPVAIVRYFNTYGPRLHVNGYGSVVANFIRQALAGEPLTVYGDGKQSRCFCYVQDTVDGTIAAMSQACLKAPVFNVGNPAEISVLQLAWHILEAAGSTSGIKFVPYIEAYGQGYEDTRIRVPSIQKLTEATSWAPSVDLSTGLGHTIAWCRENW